jgi:peptidyl-prolyl cis-trans isomerase SurA
VATKDVDKYIAAAPSAGEDELELILQRVRLNMPAKLNDNEVAQRVSQAEAIRLKFTDCKSTNAIVAGAPGVRVDELGKRKPSSFQEPTRSLLLSARDNEMLPPTVGDGGVDLFAVCGRNVIKAAEQKRTQAEGELKQKEFEMLSKKHLKDLRQDASIEYR